VAGFLVVERAAGFFAAGSFFSAELDRFAPIAVISICDSELL
jgi:hypothetical protein